MITTIIFIAVYSIFINIMFFIELLRIPSRQEAQRNIDTYFTIFYIVEFKPKELLKANINACCKNHAVEIFYSDYLSNEGIFPDNVKIKSIHKGA